MIVEMKNDLIAVRGVCLANSSYLRDYFKFKKTPVYLESCVTKIKDGSVTVRTKDGKETVIKADSVITSVGYTSGRREKIAHRGRRFRRGQSAYGDMAGAQSGYETVIRKE